MEDGGMDRGSRVEDRGNVPSTTLNPPSSILHPPSVLNPQSNVAVLITGGFHTTNLKSLLKNKNISFVSLTPQVLQETNQARYEKILLDQGEILLGQKAPKMISSVNTLRTLQIQTLRAIADGSPTARQFQEGFASLPARGRAGFDGVLGVAGDKQLSAARLAGRAEPDFSHDPTDHSWHFAKMRGLLQAMMKTPARSGAALQELTERQKWYSQPRFKDVARAPRPVNLIIGILWDKYFVKQNSTAIVTFFANLPKDHLQKAVSTLVVAISGHKSDLYGQRKIVKEAAATNVLDAVYELATPESKDIIIETLEYIVDQAKKRYDPVISEQAADILEIFLRGGASAARLAGSTRDDNPYEPLPMDSASDTVVPPKASAPNSSLPPDLVLRSLAIGQMLSFLVTGLGLYLLFYNNVSMHLDDHAVLSRDSFPFMGHADLVYVMFFSAPIYFGISIAIVFYTRHYGYSQERYPSGTGSDVRPNYRDHLQHLLSIYFYFFTIIRRMIQVSGYDTGSAASRGFVSESTTRGGNNSTSAARLGIEIGKAFSFNDFLAYVAREPRMNNPSSRWTGNIYVTYINDDVSGALTLMSVVGGEPGGAKIGILVRPIIKLDTTLNGKDRDFTIPGDRIKSIQIELRGALLATDEMESSGTKALLSILGIIGFITLTVSLMMRSPQNRSIDRTQAPVAQRAFLLDNQVGDPVAERILLVDSEIKDTEEVRAFLRKVLSTVKKFRDDTEAQAESDPNATDSLKALEAFLGVANERVMVTNRSLDEPIMLGTNDIESPLQDGMPVEHVFVRFSWPATKNLRQMSEEDWELKLRPVLIKFGNEIIKHKENKPQEKLPKGQPVRYRGTMLANTRPPSSILQPPSVLSAARLAKPSKKTIDIETYAAAHWVIGLVLGSFYKEVDINQYLPVPDKPIQTAANNERDAYAFMMYSLKERARAFQASVDRLILGQAFVINGFSNTKSVWRPKTVDNQKDALTAIRTVLKDPNITSRIGFAEQLLAVYKSHPPDHEKKRYLGQMVIRIYAIEKGLEAAKALIKPIKGKKSQDENVNGLLEAASQELEEIKLLKKAVLALFNGDYADAKRKIIADWNDNHIVQPFFKNSQDTLEKTVSPWEALLGQTLLSDEIKQAVTRELGAAQKNLNYLQDIIPLGIAEIDLLEAQAGAMTRLGGVPAEISNAARLATRLNRRAFLETGLVATAPLLAWSASAADDLENSTRYVHDEAAKTWSVVRNGIVLPRKAHIGGMVYTPAYDIPTNLWDKKMSEFFAALFESSELFDRNGKAKGPALQALDPVQQKDIQKRLLGHAKRLMKMGVKNIRTYYLPTDDPKQIDAIKEMFRMLWTDYGIRVTAGHWIGFWNKPGSPALTSKGDREAVKVSLRKFVEIYGEEPWLDTINLGNEINYFLDKDKDKAFPSKQDPFTPNELIQYKVEMASEVVLAFRALNARRASAGKKPVEIPVSLALGGLTDEQAQSIKKYNAIEEAKIGEKPVKAISVNLYPGVNHKDGSWNGDVSLIERAAASAELAGLPLIIQEIGLPNQNAAGEDQAARQLEFMKKVFEVVERTPNIIRVTWFQFNNNPWKAKETGKSHEGRYGVSDPVENSGLFISSEWEGKGPGGVRSKTPQPKHPTNLRVIVNEQPLSGKYGHKTSEKFYAYMRKVTELERFPSKLSAMKDSYVVLRLNPKVASFTKFTIQIRGKNGKGEVTNYITTFSKTDNDWAAQGEKATSLSNGQMIEIAVSAKDLIGFFGEGGEITEFHVKQGINEGNVENENITIPQVLLAAPSAARLANKNRTSHRSNRIRHPHPPHPDSAGNNKSGRGLVVPYLPDPPLLRPRVNKKLNLSSVDAEAITNGLVSFFNELRTREGMDNLELSQGIPMTIHGAIHFNSREVLDISAASVVSEETTPPVFAIDLSLFPGVESKVEFEVRFQDRASQLVFASLTISPKNTTPANLIVTASILKDSIARVSTGNRYAAGRVELINLGEIKPAMLPQEVALLGLGKQGDIRTLITLSALGTLQDSLRSNADPSLPTDKQVIDSLKTAQKKRSIIEIPTQTPWSSVLLDQSYPLSGWTRSINSYLANSSSGLRLVITVIKVTDHSFNRASREGSSYVVEARYLNLRQSDEPAVFEDEQAKKIASQFTPIAARLASTDESAQADFDLLNRSVRAPELRVWRADFSETSPEVVVTPTDGLARNVQYFLTDLVPILSRTFTESLALADESGEVQVYELTGRDGELLVVTGGASYILNTSNGAVNLARQEDRNTMKNTRNDELTKKLNIVLAANRAGHAVVPVLSNLAVFFVDVSNMPTQELQNFAIHQASGLSPTSMVVLLGDEGQVKKALSVLGETIRSKQAGQFVSLQNLPESFKGQGVSNILLTNAQSKLPELNIELPSNLLRVTLQGQVGGQAPVFAFSEVGHMMRLLADGRLKEAFDYFLSIAPEYGIDTQKRKAMEMKDFKDFLEGEKEAIANFAFPAKVWATFKKAMQLYLLSRTVESNA